jgi:ATPase family associated with various cellular activities (AAA)
MSVQQGVSDTLSGFFRGEDVVIKEIIDILKKITSCSSWTYILKGVPRIFLIIAIKYYITSPEKLYHILSKSVWNFIKTLFYKTINFSKSDNRQKLSAQKFEDLYKKENTKFGIPFFIENTEEETKVHYIPKIHNSIVSCTIENSDQEYKNKDGSTKLLCYNTGTYRHQVASTLFPSKNYQNLTKMISTYVEISKLNNCFSTLGILLDGCPGLGKSNCINYLAQQNIVDFIYKVDLNTNGLSSKQPTELFKELYHNIPVINGPTVFVIDEMDKYLDFHIYNSFTKKHDPNNKPVLEFDTLKKQIQREFLSELLSVLERSNISQPCIVIFCCNNFLSIFDGIDNTHFESLKDRFMRVTFEMCDKKEIIRFLEYYNNRFINTKFFFENLKELLESLKYNVQITFRQLCMITTHEEYCFPKIVSRLNTEFLNVDEKKECTKKLVPIECKSEKNTVLASEQNTIPTSSIEENNLQTPITIVAKVEYEKEKISFNSDEKECIHCNVKIDKDIIIEDHEDLQVCENCAQTKCLYCGTIDNLFFSIGETEYKICNRCKTETELENRHFSIISVPQFCIKCKTTSIKQTTKEFLVVLCDNCNKKFCNNCLLPYQTGYIHKDTLKLTCKGCKSIEGHEYFSPDKIKNINCSFCKMKKDIDTPFHCQICHINSVIPTYEICLECNKNRCISCLSECTTWYFIPSCEYTVCVKCFEEDKHKLIPTDNCLKCQQPLVLKNSYNRLCTNCNEETCGLCLQRGTLYADFCKTCFSHLIYKEKIELPTCSMCKKSSICYCDKCCLDGLQFCHPCKQIDREKDFTPQEKIKQKIKEYLIIIQDLSRKKEKIPLTIQLFDFMAHPDNIGHIQLFEKEFHTTVKNKIKDLSETDPELSENKSMQILVNALD